MKLFRNVFLLCIIVSFMTQLIYIVSPDLTLSLIQKIVLICIQYLSIIGFVHFFLVGKSSEIRRKVILRTHWLLFIIYCFNLIYILLFDPDFGRHIIEEGTSYQDYGINYHLFETIQLFIHGYQNDIVSLETLLRNLCGNLVIFVPMAYFLPVLFKRQRHFIIFLLTLVFMVLGVEILQVFMKIGSGDIDDFFLNVVGSIVVYGCLKCCVLKKIYGYLERE